MQSTSCLFLGLKKDLVLCGEGRDMINKSNNKCKKFKIRICDTKGKVITLIEGT